MSARQIYALVDPRDKTVRYIGISKDVQVRLAQHMGEIQNDKRIWLTELKQLGLLPEIAILETIEAEQDIDSLSLERERLWIREFLQSGAPLVNISGIPHTRRSSALSGPHRKATNQSAFGQVSAMSGLSVGQLAKEARVSTSTIYKMEKGQPVKVEFAVRACKVLSHYLDYEITYKNLNMVTV